MNCEVVQRQLLSGESPDCPSANASAHLADCAACREWLTRLVQMERAVPYLPVPPAEAARSALVRRILAQKAGDKGPATKARRRPSIAMVLGSWIMDPHASPRRRVAAGLVAGVAAALLLFVIGWLVWSGGDASDMVAAGTQKLPTDQLLADLGRAGIHTADGKTGGERVHAMAAVAERLHDKCPELAKSGAYPELIEKAQLYVRVVDEGIVKTAEGLSPSARRAILGPIAADLEKAESNWSGLAISDLSGDAKRALTRAAETARDAAKQLREMCA